MDNNLDQVAKDLYGKIRTRFPQIKMGDENAEVLSKKTDIPNARFFEFEYEHNGEPLGTIAITLDQDDGVVIQLSDELSNLSETSMAADDDLYTFLRSFRLFAKKRLLNYDVQNIGKSNLDKRDYEFRAKPKEFTMMENKMFGTSRISYQDLGEAKLVVKHNKPVNPNLAAGRSMNIESIYIENSDGERFKYPYKHLHGARAIAEHIKHGGTPYDSIGRHIVGLSEELTQLRKFKNYVGRQTQLSEAMGTITDKVVERIDAVKKEVQQLQRKSYYEQFAENFQEYDAQEIPESIMQDWQDRLTIRSFNEDIKQVFPYLYNIMETSSLPVRELDMSDIDDLLSESVAPRPNKISSYNPSLILETFLNRIISEDKDELFSEMPGARNKAIKDLNILLSSELAGGEAGVLALRGLIDDRSFTNKISVLKTDSEIRNELKQYLLDKEPEIIPLLPNLDSKSPAEIGGESPAGAEPPAGGEMPPAPPMGGEAPPAPPMGGEVPPAPPMGGEMPPAPPMGGEMPPAPPMGATVPPAPVAESIKMRAKFIKAKMAGATLDSIIAEGITIRDAIKECGLDNEECGFSSNKEQSRSSGVDELLKVISGFWNATDKNFTIGGTRAKIKVVKAFQDGECPSATEDDVKQALLFITKKDPSTDASVEPTSLDDIDTDNREKHMFDKMIYMQEEPVMESELDKIKRFAGIYK
jgi:hypothetical protein